MNQVLLISFGLAAISIGCSDDVFHSTRWKSICDTEPKTYGCPAASDAGGKRDADSGQDASSDAKADSN